MLPRPTISGENLFDERHRLARLHADFGRADTPAPPPLAGVCVNWDFAG